MKSTPDYLFNYLRDMLFDTSNATLDLDKLPMDFRKLGEGLLYLCQCVQETKTLAKALSRGDLHIPLPASDNEIAAPLKNLHSSLKHLTWQAQQVAKGDYGQRVDFMGDFSESFNFMVAELDRNRSELLDIIDNSQKKSKALENANDLLEAITRQLPQRLIVIDRKTGEWLFTNRPVQNILPTQQMLDTLETWFKQWICREDSDSACEELEITDGDSSITLASTSYALQWHGCDAVAFIFVDITQDKIRLKNLEDIAFRDVATQTYNRRYGMQVLGEWLSEGKQFILCFVDMDNLKYVNDTFGHAGGDAYIIRVTNVLREFAPNVFVSRLGGDEFMLLAQNCNLTDAVNRMEYLRSLLSQYNNLPDARYEHSISYGLVPSDGKHPVPASDLLALADKRMYDYKRARKAQRRN